MKSHNYISNLRPGILTQAEEDVLAALVKDLRNDGVPIDADTIIAMAQEIILDTRGLSKDELPPLSADWVRGCAALGFLVVSMVHITRFKKRQNLSNLRVSSSDRPVSSPEMLLQDDKWRAEVNGNGYL